MARDLQVLTASRSAAEVNSRIGAVPWSRGSWSLRRSAKVAVAYALYYLGLLHLWRLIVLRNRAVVLMYHRVLTTREWAASGSHPGIVVRPETFRRHLDLLARHFSVLTLRDFVHHLETDTPFPHSSCLITFDDGWYDGLANAAPALRDSGLPAVMFLPVNYPGTRRCFWRESLSHLVLAAVRRARSGAAARAELAGILRPARLEFVLDLDEPQILEQIIVAVASLALDRAAAEKLVADLVAALCVDVTDLAGPDRFVAWSDLDALSSAGFSFGSHGSEHLRLAEVPREVARQDIRRSREVLTARTSADVQVFSYPNGAWSHAIAEEVRAAGFRVAFTTDTGFVSSGDEPLAIRRINIHEDASCAPPLFLARILGLF